MLWPHQPQHLSLTIGWFIETAGGTFVADNVHDALDGQFINPVNGRVVAFVVRQNIRSAEGVDGSSEVVITGVLGKVRIPARVSSPPRSGG